MDLTDTYTQNAITGVDGSFDEPCSFKDGTTCIGTTLRLPSDQTVGSAAGGRWRRRLGSAWYPLTRAVVLAKGSSSVTA